MSHADVTIAPNAFDDLSESAFLAGLNFAYSDLWTDWCEAVQDLKDKKGRLWRPRRRLNTVAC